MPRNGQATTEDSNSRVEELSRLGDGTDPVDSLPDAAATLQQVEKLLSQIRAALDASARERVHREYSLGRMVGAILQVIVVGLVAVALLDWLLRVPAELLFIKLAFAAVLQLAALTAFVLSRGGS